MRSSSGGAAAGVAIIAAVLGAATAQAQVFEKPPADAGLSMRLYEIATNPELADASGPSLSRSVGLPGRGPGSLIQAQHGIVVVARAAGSVAAAKNAIAAAGGEVVPEGTDGTRITAIVAPDELAGIAATPAVGSLVEEPAPTGNGTGDATGSAISTCAGSVTTEADTQMNAAAARAQFDVDGSGVKVGVLSDSYDLETGDSTSAAQDVASGDLPGAGNPCGRTTPVQVLAEGGATDVDEGRAMLELVHDLAPGAALAFSTSQGGQNVFANHIRDLAAAGAKVIVDDWTYFAEPFFQDGPVAKAVNDVTAQGVTYFSSAANSNAIDAGTDIGSWETPAFRNGGPCVGVLAGAGTCLDFSPENTNSDRLFGFSLGPNESTTVILQWAQPWDGVTNDLDLYLLDQNATTILEQSTNTNTGAAGTQEPSEFLNFTNPNNATTSFRIAIANFAGTATPRVKFATLEGVVSYEYLSSGGDTVGPTIFGHNGASTAMSTAAVPFDDGSAIEDFSSRGPVTTYFNPVNDNGTPATANTQVLAKPDIAATDGGQTTFFFDLTAPFTAPIRFYGTSAAAPDAAAVAALQLSANPAQSVAQVKAGQTSTATPVGTFGPQAQGAGLVDAPAAVAANPPAAPVVAISGPTITNDTTPTFTFTNTGHAKAVICGVDTGTATACASPLTLGALPEGKHRFGVLVGDYFGGVGVGAIDFTIDLKAPKLKIKKHPKKVTTKKKAKFKFATEAGATLRCQLDKKPAKPCKASAKFKVNPGKHKLAVTSTDAAGNVASAVYKWERV